MADQQLKTTRSRKADNAHPGRAISVFLLTVAAASTIAFGAVDAWSTGLLAFAASGILAAWATAALRAKELTIYVDAIYIPLVGLILIGLIQLLPLGARAENAEALGVSVSNTLSLNPWATKMFVVRLTIVLIFLAAGFTFLNSRKRLERCALAIIAFGAVMALFGILQRLSGAESIYGIRPSPQAIPFGPFINQHHFAAFMEMTSGLALAMLIGRKTRGELRILLTAAIVVMGIAVVFTGSRGGMISYAGVVALTVLLSLSRSRGSASGEAKIGQLAALAAGAALVFIVTAIGFFLGGGEALFRGLGPGQADITSGRTHFWQVAWQIFLDRPLFGAGLDAFGVAFTRYDTWNGAFRIEQAHNDYLQILADAGIAGFICVAAFIFLLARRSLAIVAGPADERRVAIAIGAFAGCVGILIHSVFDFPLRTTSNALFFALLTVLACAVVERENGRRHKRRKIGEASVSEPLP